jgi:hypothetical protein
MSTAKNLSQTIGEYSRKPPDSGFHKYFPGLPPSYEDQMTPWVDGWFGLPGIIMIRLKPKWFDVDIGKFVSGLLEIGNIQILTKIPDSKIGGMFESQMVNIPGLEVKLGGINLEDYTLIHGTEKLTDDGTATSYLRIIGNILIIAALLIISTIAGVKVALKIKDAFPALANLTLTGYSTMKAKQWKDYQIHKWNLLDEQQGLIQQAVHDESDEIKDYIDEHTYQAWY